MRQVKSRCTCNYLYEQAPPSGRWRSTCRRSTTGRGRSCRRSSTGSAGAPGTPSTPTSPPTASSAAPEVCRHVLFTGEINSSSTCSARSCPPNESMNPPAAWPRAARRRGSS
ncbi:hypothetical protein PVAP13_9KG392501 [Panicum virgatum]|uniref:Uncharacterized protein n=1 Tax=Panicum virgatum TaxID=38727 RepID=A0A8T0NW18_PANVG|nr:hypothetical protein PVAP13_9KG392501 [Panicum virgatum]